MAVLVYRTPIHFFHAFDGPGIPGIGCLHSSSIQLADFLYTSVHAYITKYIKYAQTSVFFSVSVYLLVVPTCIFYVFQMFVWSAKEE